MTARKLSVLIDNNSSFSAHTNENCKKKKNSFSIILRSLTNCMENRL